MPVRLLRLIAAIVLLPWQLAVTPVAPEHRHVSHDDHHEHAAAHRHISAHATGHAHDRTHEGLASDDDHVIVVSDAAIGQADDQVTLPPARLVSGWLFPAPPARQDVDVSQTTLVPAHGPPRAAALFRGPPLRLS